jgi:hypothetical protein
VVDGKLIYRMDGFKPREADLGCEWLLLAQRGQSLWNNPGGSLPVAPSAITPTISLICWTSSALLGDALIQPARATSRPSGDERGHTDYAFYGDTVAAE